MLKAFAAAAFVAACTLPALADDSHAPVTINKCQMGYEHPNDDSTIGQGVAFTNTAHHAITAIRFNFTYLSAFNEVLGGTLETDTGTFAPGVLIDHVTKSLGHQLFSANPGGLVTYYWQSDNTAHVPLAQMKLSCSVDAVSFEDGAVWTAHH